MAASTGCPGSCSSLTTASASITTAPRSASPADTVDFPDPIPPVSPITSTSADRTTRSGTPPTTAWRGAGAPADEAW